MVKIFSYGTLTNINIQIFEFGMTFSMSTQRHHVSGWELDVVSIGNDVFNTLIPSSVDKIVGGWLLDVPENKLSLIDDYEGSEYKRIKLTTLEGVDCFIYVSNEI